MIKNIPLSMKLPVAVFLLTVLMSAAIILFSYKSVTSLFEKQEISNQLTKTSLISSKLSEIEHRIEDDFSRIVASLADGTLDLSVLKTSENWGSLVLGAKFLPTDGTALKRQSIEYSDNPGNLVHFDSRLTDGLGTLTLKLSTEFLNSWLTIDADPDRILKTAVFRENGDALLQADFPDALAMSNVVSGLIGAAANTSEVVTLSDGSKHFVAFQSVELAGQDLTLVVSEDYETAMQGRNDFVKTLLAIVNFCALGFMLLATLFMRTSVEPMKQMQTKLNLIASQKDLTINLPQTYKDEVGKSLSSVKSILTSFDVFVRDAKLGSDELLSISDQMADIVARLARETELRATSIEELSQSLAQTEAQTSFTANLAESAESDMQQADLAASDGKAKIGELTAIVEQIADASADISSVINAIEGIAFQTNLLALNASVEAARAGAHGKGFAVVATEVGQLAQRASKSAQDSAELIQQTLAKIDLSKDASQRANEAFKTISDRVHDATQTVSEISSANHEQKSAIEAASTNASNLAVSANADAAQYDRLAKASASLQHRSEAVSAQVSQYKYTDDKRSGEIHALGVKKIQQKADLTMTQDLAFEPAKIVSLR